MSHLLHFIFSLFSIRVRTHYIQELSHFAALAVDDIEYKIKQKGMNTLTEIMEKHISLYIYVSVCVCVSVYDDDLWMKQWSHKYVVIFVLWWDMAAYKKFSSFFPVFFVIVFFLLFPRFTYVFRIIEIWLRQMLRKIMTFFY